MNMLLTTEPSVTLTWMFEQNLSQLALVVTSELTGLADVSSLSAAFITPLNHPEATRKNKLQ